jgi:exonuclease III
MQLKIVIWNANGLAQHVEEVKTYTRTRHVDIILISETHFASRSYFKIPNFTAYDTRHPDGTAHGGTAILIKNGLKHHLHGHYTADYLQATAEDWVGPLTIAAVYCPPKHVIKADQFRHFYTTLGHRFLAGGDFNAKHTHWGSRITTPRGRELFKATQADKLLHVSTGEPTYWPTDRRKIPDLLDFGIRKCIPQHCVEAEAGFDFSSDHSPVLVTMHTRLAQSSKPPTLTTNRTNWATFKQYIQDNLTLQVPLKTNRDIEDYVNHHTAGCLDRNTNPSQTSQTKLLSSSHYAENPRQTQATPQMATHQVSS